MITLVSTGRDGDKFAVWLHAANGKTKVAKTFDALAWANQAASEWHLFLNDPAGSVGLSLWEEFEASA